MNITEVELLSYKNFGETSLREIKTILESKSLQLGLALKEKQLASAESADYSPVEDKDEQLLSKSMDELQLSVRSRKCLQKLDIRTVSDLIRKTDAELLGKLELSRRSLD